MKKHALPIASLLLIAMLAASAASCGGDAPAADTTAATGEATEPVETSVIDTLAKADYKGHEFRFFGEKQATFGDYFDAEEETGDVINDNVYRRNRTVEELYNIKISHDTVDWGKGKGDGRIRELIMAGDNSYDLFTSTHLYLGSLLVEGFFVDWRDVPGIDFDAPCYVQDANETYSIGDARPLLFGDFMETNSMRCWSFLFNKRLVNEYKIEDPYTVVDEGRWTMDYLIKSTRDIAVDVDGNAEMNELDLYGFATDRLATVDGFSRALGLTAIIKDKNNLPVLDYWKESTVTAYEKLYTLYYENPGTYATPGNLTHVEEVFAQGRAVFSSTRLDFVMKEAMRDMEDDYGVLPYPKLDESGEYATYLSGTFSAQMIGVTQPEADWERTGTIVHALNVLSHEYVIPAIYDVTLKTKTTRDEDSARMMDMIFENRRFSFDSVDEQGFMLSPVRSVRALIGSQQSKDIASHYAANETQAKDWIQKMIDAYNDAK